MKYVFSICFSKLLIHLCGGELSDVYVMTMFDITGHWLLKCFFCLSPQLLKKMSSSDTPLGTVALLQEKQKSQKTPYIVLSGSGKSMNAYVYT